jgi:outer membrane protein assembly factor BamB
MSRGALLLLFVASPAFAQPEWPHVRGPNYDAVSTETGLVASWPAAGPPVLWTRELGQGYSGFTIATGRVFTQYQTKLAQFVVALDAETGTELWRVRVGLPWQPAGAYPGPYATPTVHGGRVFYTTPMGEAGCLEASSGREVWSVDLRKTFGMRGVDFGYAATPLVESGRVILSVGGETSSLVALDAANGRTVWTAGTDPASYCPAYPITFRGRRLIVAYLQNSIALHDAVTGERLWRQRLSSHYDEHSAWPLWSEPHLLFAAPFRAGAQLFRLSESGTELKVQTVWNAKALSNDVCSSVLFEKHVYGFDLHQLQSSPHRGSRGSFKCLEFETGHVAWETEDVGQSTVLVADGKLILLNDTGTLILARATPTAFEELVRAKVLDGGLCWTPPALCGRKLYVRNPAKMACLYLGPESDLDPSRPLERSHAEDDGFEWSRLLGREPEFPHDAPTAADVGRWFLGCVAGVFAPALLVAWVLSRFGSRNAFAVAAAILGAIGTTLYSRWADAFVLTWPASLYVAFRALLVVSVWAGVQPWSLRRRGATALALLAFVSLGYGYYRLCTATGYVMAWSFLAGFLPAMPFAAIAAKTRRRWLSRIADAVAFAIYFWFSGLLPGWKTDFEA